MSLPSLLFADLDDWIRLAVIVIFVLGPLLGHLGKRPQKQGGAGQPQPGKPAAPRPQKQPKGLVGEIERILREAQQAAEHAMAKAEDEVKRERPQAPPAKHDPTVVILEELPQRTTPRTAKRQRDRLESSVATHVDEHIKSRPVTDRGKSLGRRIAQANERIEKRLHDAFDHELGGLGSTTGPTGAEDGTRGTGSVHWRGVADTRAREAEVVNVRREFILGMLHNREQLRNAFVLAEIISRPRSDEID